MNTIGKWLLNGNYVIHMPTVERCKAELA